MDLGDHGRYLMNPARASLMADNYVEMVYEEVHCRRSSESSYAMRLPSTGG